MIKAIKRNFTLICISMGLAGCFMFSMLGCGPTKYEVQQMELKNKRGDRTIDQDYSIMVIDGCEYIVYDNWQTGQHCHAVTHKGNCKAH